VTSAENNVLDPPNLKMFFLGGPPDAPARLVLSALAIMTPPPPRVTKDLAMALK